MTPRDRVLRAIEFKYPDRIPFLLELNFGVTDAGKRNRIIELLKKYGCDFYGCNFYDELPPAPSYKKYYDANGKYYREWTDDWGCVFAEYQEGDGGQVIKHPLRGNIDNVSTFKIPGIKKYTDAEKKRIEKYRNTYVIWLGMDIPFFHQLSYLYGFEDTLVDVSLNTKEMNILADRILEEYLLPKIAYDLEYKPDFIQLCDDWGTQDRLIINPDVWRKFIKPRYKKIVDKVHSGSSRMFLHTCGYTIDLLPEFIDLGIDLINPQIGCMDMKKYNEIAKDRICVFLTGDRQNILPYSGPEAVENHMKAIIETFRNPKGGLIITVSAEGNMSLENVEAQFVALEKYGILNRDEI